MWLPYLGMTMVAPLPTEEPMLEGPRQGWEAASTLLIELNLGMISIPPTALLV